MQNPPSFNPDVNNDNTDTSIAMITEDITHHIKKRALKSGEIAEDAEQNLQPSVCSLPSPSKI
jgi:hypothetical protein